MNPFKKLFNIRPRLSDERVVRMLAETNDELAEGGFALFNDARAVATAREVRAVLGGYGLQNEDVQQVVSLGAAAQIESLRATAAAEYEQQKSQYAGEAVDSAILAAQRLAEDCLLEGDLFAAVVSPIELGMNTRVWVSGPDTSMIEDINNRLVAWNVMGTINAAWQDMETYSAYYVSHGWKDGRPVPLHWSPKRIAVGPNLGAMSFSYLKPGKLDGKEAQRMMSLYDTPGGWDWNDWKADNTTVKLNLETLSWEHFLKPKHKMYPYPWLAKASTPTYTRQIIEEMRLALVQGLINQLWVMTVENPMPKELSALKSILSANRAERVGFLLWRAGLKVENYSPQAIEQLLLPEAWWGATLDIFRRIGRTVRIISGESAQRGGQGSDAEIDVRIAQKKAEAHRAIVANRIVTDVIRQWPEGGESVKEAVYTGKLRVHLTPIELFLGEALKEIWGPMWDRGMASVETIHAAIGLDTAAETEVLKREEEAGYGDIYIARQQFAQRVATPEGEVTSSSEPGRPNEAEQKVQAAVEDVKERLETAFDEIDAAEDKQQKITAFIALMIALLRIHMKEAYTAGYAAAYGARTPNEGSINTSFVWERSYIDGLEEDLLAHVEAGTSVAGEKYRVGQHVSASWRRGYMDGVFQAKSEDGWKFWRRVLRPWASKSGPCDICKEDSKRWHPISEPFWDHPYGVCSQQMVRFMRTGMGFESEDRRPVEVPLMEW